MQTLLGEGAKVVLEGQRVLPARAQEQGFDFKYDQVDLAVKEIVGTWEAVTYSTRFNLLPHFAYMNYSAFFCNDDAPAMYCEAAV